MIFGLGTDICPVCRWEHLYARFGERILIKIFHKDDVSYLLSGNNKRLPERLAGRWAVLEAFGKAMGSGLNGWSWKQLRFLNGRLWTENELTIRLTTIGISAIHASVSHDMGMAFAVVILEVNDITKNAHKVHKIILEIFNSLCIVNKIFH